MSDISCTFDNLYSSFVLRDILSFIFPGALVILTLSLVINPDDNRILFISEILQLLLIFGIFYLTGFSIQIMRELLEHLTEHLGRLRRLPVFLNSVFNHNTRVEHSRLLRVYQKTGHTESKVEQILERFTVFYQFFGNTCVALVCVLMCMTGIALNNPIPPWIFALLILLIFFSYLGYVIHKERRETWMSVIEEG